MRYHFGSVALGSLTISILWVVRWIFEFYRIKMSRMSKDSKIGKVLSATSGWLLWLLENFVKYFSDNAYI